MKKAAMVLALTVFASVASFAQATPPCSSAREVRRPIVIAFRVMNTAQVQFYRTNNRYANLSELLSSPALKKASVDMPAAGNEQVTFGSDDPLPGYDLRLLVTGDGKSYSLIATKKEGDCRHVGATTDERGLIYLIEPMR